MPNQARDISRVAPNWYLIFPISMSRIANAQSGKELFEFLKFFESKIPYISIDVIIIYTNWLYFNSEEPALELRKKTLNQMIAHKQEFENIILKSKKYVPQSFHFLPWDYMILNWEWFQMLKNRLMKAYSENDAFKKSIKMDLESQWRDEIDANISFLIEEIAVTHLLTHRSIPLPKTLPSEDSWRLVCYPWDPINSLQSLYKAKILNYDIEKSIWENQYCRSFYNMSEKKLLDYDR
ncbi:MAG: hypothetical protein ACD_2C00178G0001 [uncultured bacterium (gcode 4)]|uniref:Uncharacterized protein n=1 Tax=uncultured bacterium (gcode 4) TaxID=1234023 RepID=K2G540_9BACT|nr:MAG: hypothetical protein ACD_2C00178G0001 [uncultured bacterium (gcode 4)]